MNITESKTKCKFERVTDLVLCKWLNDKYQENEQHLFILIRIKVFETPILDFKIWILCMKQN
jgi:hypothetical protein